MTDLPNLPALRCLGDLADVRPTVLVDSREQMPLLFSRLPSTRGTLQSGDYSFVGGEELFAVERKTVQDLVGCTVGESRERFHRELHRLRGFRFKRLLVVGERELIEAHQYMSKISPRAVLGTLSVIEARFDVPVVFEPTPEAAARRIETWAWYFSREIVEATNSLARAVGLTRRAGAPAQAEPSAAGSEPEEVCR